MVTYLLAQTGGRIFGSRRLERSRLYQASQAITGDRARVVLEQLNTIPQAALPYIPDLSNARRFFVLHSGHFEPFDAVCTSGR